MNSTNEEGTLPIPVLCKSSPGTHDPNLDLLSHTGDNKPVEKTTKRIKKCSKEQTILMIFGWLLGITPPDQLNVSSILFQSLRWNPEIKTMTRTDQNAVMMETFKSKRMIGYSLQSVKLLLEEYEKRAMMVIDREIRQQKYTHAEIDRIISKLIFVMKSDVNEVNKLIIPHVHNKDYQPHHVFYYMNATAKIALEREVRWAAIASQNAIASKLFYKAKIPIEQFIVNSDIGFDEEQFKQEKERSRERNLVSSQMRQQISFQRSFMKNMNNAHYRERPRNKPNSNTSTKSKFGEMIAFHNDFLRHHFPNTKWSNQHCGFWNHPTLKCKFGDKCPRKHTCPNCEGQHILKDCPNIDTHTTNK